jgi:putative hemolysin
MDSEHPEDRVTSVKGDQSAMPDISIQHCLDDGYEVVKVTKDGIPARYLCIDPKTKRKCEAWSYYRGSCRLADSDGQTPPASDIKIKGK